MKLLKVLLLGAIIFPLQLMSQEEGSDQVRIDQNGWPEGFVTAEIESSMDGSKQKAIFFSAASGNPQPLIVSLHTWSGDYLQEDPLAQEVAWRGWNYIHPDFRGPNNRPEACGSELVVADIEDAIAYAVLNGNVNQSEVHIIGLSGGGYAALVSYMKLNYPVKSFHAWAPVTNIEEWYWETKGRNLEYFHDIEKITTGGTGFDPHEARKRSPALMKLQPDKRQDASLFIYTGIHDGYTGSVPVTHSINMFNSIAVQLFPGETGMIIPDSIKLDLVEKRMNPSPDSSFNLGGRKIHFHREMGNIRLYIFEGGHEMIVPQALSLIPAGNCNNIINLNILTIGDSNGSASNGWPCQLGRFLPFSTIVNKSISGNTLGFDNLENQDLNTLRNITRYLEEAYAELPAGQDFDYIICALGTNDAKMIFEKRRNEVAKNLNTLILEIDEFFIDNEKPLPRIMIVSPPPVEESRAGPGKYDGANGRLADFSGQFRKVAKKHDLLFNDIYSTLRAKDAEVITTDGVHLTARAQFKMGRIIAEKIIIQICR